MRARLLPFLAGAVGLTLALTACGGSDSADVTETAASVPPTASSEPAQGEPSSDSTDQTSAAPATSTSTTIASTTIASTTIASTAVQPTEVARSVDLVPAPTASNVSDLLSLDRPIVIAHAGGDFEAPHSTMYAFTLAALAGTDVLEMDVMLTADDVLVVHHDDTVDRTTETTGSVRDLTYDQLAALDNAHWFVDGTWSDQSKPAEAYELRGIRTGDRQAPAGFGPDDFRIETFRSVATAFPDHVLDVEIKIQRDAQGEPDLARAEQTARVLADEIAELGRTESTIVVSFDAATIDAFRTFAPDVATSPALDTLVAWYVGEPVEFAPSDVVFQVPPFYEGVEVLTPDVIARAQSEGFDVWVWMDDTSSQETADFYRDLLSRGADGLLVSRPTVAVDVIGTP